MRGKLKSKKGYTLVEMLAAIVVLILMCVGIGSGLSAAANVYYKMLFVSNSQVLEDTIDTEFSYVLRMARDVKEKPKTDGSSQSLYVRSDRNNALQGVDGGYIDIEKHKGENTIFYAYAASGETTNWLVNPGTYLGMSIKDFSLTYDDDSKVYEGTYTIVSEHNDKLTKKCTFKCASLMQ